MKSLVGFYVVCELTFNLYNPAAKIIVTARTQAKCLVIDDLFEPVGTYDEPRYPMIVDCTRDRNYKMLAPSNEKGVYLFHKGDQCVE